MFDDANSIIETRLNDNWTTTSIQFDNVRFVPVVGTAFIRLQVEWAASNVISIGGRIKSEGYVLISIFVPYGSGNSTIMGYADTIAGLFNMYHEGSIRFKSAIINRVGANKEWFQINVEIPFDYDTCWNFSTPCPEQP